MVSTLEQLDVAGLAGWLVEQRWFASKSRDVGALRILEAAELGEDQEPRLALALVEVRFHPGTHEIYQVPLGLRRDEEGWSEGTFARADGWTVYDAVADPRLAREFLQMMRGARSLEANEAEVRFCPAAGEIEEVGEARRLGGEQSNSSVVFDDAYIMKVYRRLEAGVNPELELLRFLTERESSTFRRCAAGTATWVA